METMSSSPGPSPAWLGIAAVASFAGLVIAAFASGYHLVGEAPPGVSSAAPGAEARAQNAVSTEPARLATVREQPRQERAVVRRKPETGEVLDHLSAEQRVTILAEEGDWFQIRYERQGQEREGWTHQVNLSVVGR
jgi:hypothetical protein